jgi:hypothetical protein
LSTRRWHISVVESMPSFITTASSSGTHNNCYNNYYANYNWQNYCKNNYRPANRASTGSIIIVTIIAIITIRIVTVIVIIAWSVIWVIWVVAWTIRIGRVWIWASVFQLSSPIPYVINLEIYSVLFLIVILLTSVTIIVIRVSCFNIQLVLILSIRDPK